MEKRQTREQLLIEAAKLRDSHAGWVSGDERRRKEFAKAFNWRKPKEMYSPGENEPSVPTWEQIFVEVGKLLAARNFYDFEGNISELECKFEDLEKKIRKEIHPNL